MKIKKIVYLLACVYAAPVLAEEATPNAENLQLDKVVVTATRSAQKSFDLPVAVDVVNQNDIQTGQWGMTLSESLIRTPGITAQSRNQFAQDPQISSRGFGSRSAFGVRGIRLYVDGIPLTMPDGIGQPGNVDLSAVRAIEVMRGPFSALYGNSSGGVVQMLTENAPARPEISASFAAGSYGTRRETASAAGRDEAMEYLLNYSHFSTDGYRQQSQADKDQFTGKFRFNINEYTKLTVLANWFDLKAQDPLGARRNATRYANGYIEPSAFDSPRLVPTSAITANTRVNRSNTQIGFNLEHTINENNQLNLIAYVGNRENQQFISISPTSAVGRSSEISRDYWGGELRWVNKGMLLARPYTLSAGLAYGTMTDNRTDISALNGTPNAYTLANLNRREVNKAYNFDQYIQAQWAVLNNVDLHLGVRNTKVNVEVDDNLVNPVLFKQGVVKYADGSGATQYHKTTPVIGVTWKATPALNFYANYGKGFETPTLIELAYSTPTGLGPNLSLQPSTSDNYEIGMKAFVTDNTRVNATLFRTNTNKEIVASNTGTYQVYTNAGKTKRQGLELSAESYLPHNFSLYGAYTLLDAKFDSSFIGGNGLVNSGNTIPGTYRQQLYGEVAWKYPQWGFFSALEARYNSKIYVDDINSDAAPAYTIFNLRAGFEQNLSHWRLSEFLRVENIADRNYISSVRVNDGNARFFEPGAGRNYMVGVSASYRF